MSKQDEIAAYPLQWPLGYHRTAADSRKDSPYKQTPDAAQKFLHSQLKILKADDVVVSSNVPIRRDGKLYANFMSLAGQADRDPGVAVYFMRKGKRVVLACDTYKKVHDNIYAVGRTIERLRLIERDGVSDFLDRTFSGFMALPAPIMTPFKRDWWEVLGVSRYASAEAIKEAYRDEIKTAHPDRGGSVDRFNEIQQAYGEAMKSFNK